MSDDEIIQERISGHSARAIAKSRGVALSEVNRALDEFADLTIDDRLRKNSLALELARLDAMQLVFYERAIKEGDVNSGMLVAKLISVRCSMLGLHTPQTAVLKIVEDAAPKETGTDRIERTLINLMNDPTWKDRDGSANQDGLADPY
jgi:hypothetical protein